MVLLCKGRDKVKNYDKVYVRLNSDRYCGWKKKPYQERVLGCMRLIGHIGMYEADRTYT